MKRRLFQRTYFAVVAINRCARGVNPSAAWQLCKTPKARSYGYYKTSNDERLVLNDEVVVSLFTFDLSP